MRGRVLATAIAFAVLVGCSSYIALTFRWRDALAVLAHADLALFVGGAGAATMVYWLLRAVRWQILLRTAGLGAGFRDTYLCSTLALALSVLTPVQSGEALKVELMRRRSGLGRMPGYGTFLIERVADLYAIGAFGLLALAWRGWMQGAAVAIALACMPLAVSPLLQRVRSRGRAGHLLEQLRESMASATLVARVCALTFLAWSAVALAWWASLKSVGVELNARETLSLVVTITLATLASLVPGGLGVAEAGTAVLLGRFGFDAAHAQAGALALRAFTLLVLALGALHLPLLRLRASTATQENDDHPLS